MTPPNPTSHITNLIATEVHRRYKIMVNILIASENTPHAKLRSFWSCNQLNMSLGACA